MPQIVWYQTLFSACAAVFYRHVHYVKFLQCGPLLLQMDADSPIVSLSWGIALYNKTLLPALPITRTYHSYCMHPLCGFLSLSPLLEQLHCTGSRPVSQAGFESIELSALQLTPKRREKSEREKREGKGIIISTAELIKSKRLHNICARDDRRSTSSLFYTLSFPLQVVGEVELLGRVVFLSLLFLLLGGRELMLIRPLW